MSGLHKGKPKHGFKHCGGKKSGRHKSGRKGQRAYFREPRGWQKRKNPKRLRLKQVPAIPARVEKPEHVKRAWTTVVGLCVMCGYVQEGFGGQWVFDRNREMERRLEAANLRFNYTYCPPCGHNFNILTIIARQAKLMRQNGHLTIALVKEWR